MKYGLIIETTRESNAPFYAMDDSCHDTAIQAFDEAVSFYQAEGTRLAGYSQRVHGIFATDEAGNFSTYMNREQIILAYENGEEALQRENDADSLFGSYADQHYMHGGRA